MVWQRYCHRVIAFILTAVFDALTTKGFSDQTNWFIYAAFINAFFVHGHGRLFRFYNLEENKSSIIHHSFSIILVNTRYFLLWDYYLLQRSQNGQDLMIKCH